MSDYTELIHDLRYCADRDRPDCSICWYESTDKCKDRIKLDAAAAIEELQAEQKKTVTQIFGEEQMAWEGRCKDLMYQIADLQAQLPKRGEWQKAKPKGVVTYSDGYAECSHCHETIWLGWGMNFCPHWGTQNKIIDPDDYDGAKMEVQE